MGDYKLSYFNLKVLGEPIRWIFHAANQKFEDDRIEAVNWPEKKPTLLWGQLPVLTFGGGKTLTQSVAISEFLAKKFNFVPSDEVQQARCMEIVLHIQDCRTKWAPYYLEQDSGKREDIRKELKTNVFPHFLSKFNDIVADNGGNYVVGTKVTWADFWLTNFLEIWRDTVDPNLLDKYPALQKQMMNVLAIPGIKAWVEKRPDASLFGFVM